MVPNRYEDQRKCDPRSNEEDSDSDEGTEGTAPLLVLLLDVVIVLGKRKTLGHGGEERSFLGEGTRI